MATRTEVMYMKKLLAAILLVYVCFSASCAAEPVSSGASFEIDVPDYRDIRDDRVYSYFELKSGQSKRFVTLLHSSFTGTYYLPAVNCEAMYDYSIRATTTGEWVNVVK